MSRLALAVVLTVGLGLGLLATGAGGGTTHRPAPSAARGVVDITTRLALPGMATAGTGIVLGRGEVLTNNHVIRGAVQIHVTTPGGRRYRARVLGTDAADDVALLGIRGASTLSPARLGDSSRLALGQRIRAVGNAGGAGGKAGVAGGRVTGLHRSISTTAEIALPSEHLTGLVRTDAHLEPGDSGGPLVDAAGKVVGLDTAASIAAPGEPARRPAEAFAIPIDDALAIVRAIEAGRASRDVHIGPTPAVGVVLLDVPLEAGVLVGGVVPGSPADAAGLTPGAMIVSLDGTAVPSSAAFGRLVQRHRPGDQVRLRWLGASGVHVARVRLGTGPAA
jgi:S1-C subfamily serine protease